MKLPNPRPGLVIRYGFLWSHEARGGATEASKDRPCAIVVAARRETVGGIGDVGNIRVIVAPVTHSPPADPTASMKIPQEVCHRLGLDGEAQWLRFDELNSFSWPGYDVRPVPGRDNAEYGFLPEDLFNEVRAKIIERQRGRQVRRATDRD